MIKINSMYEDTCYRAGIAKELGIITEEEMNSIKTDARANQNFSQLLVCDMYLGDSPYVTKEKAEKWKRIEDEFERRRKNNEVELVSLALSEMDRKFYDETDGSAYDRNGDMMFNEKFIFND